MKYIRLKIIAVIAGVSLCVLLIFAMSGYSQSEPEMQEGYYTAIASEYSATGWKEYITIYVRDNHIISVEYDAKNASGFIKSWDMDYMRRMNAVNDTYPNEYCRIYADELKNRQDPQNIDAVSGATHSYENFILLAQAAIDQSLNGDKSIALVDLPEIEVAK